MALAKVTIEALSQMANILRQSAEDILLTKEQMDSELYSIPWDDPIGLSFISRYEEDFKPLKNKLVPNIESYIQYMQSEGVVVSEYSGENAGGLGTGVVGAASALGLGAAFASSQIISGGTTGFQGKQQMKKGVDYFLIANKNGTISWDDNRFEQLEKENSDFLKSEEGKQWKKNADNAFSKINDLSALTYGELHQVVGGTLGLKEGEIEYQLKKKDRATLLGWHPQDSNKAILNDNQRANMPVCAQIATFAHEGRHVYQDMVINDDGKRFNYDDELKKYVKEMREGRDNYTPASVDYEKYYNNAIEKDARKMEIIVGKACTDRYNAIEKEKQLIENRMAKPRILHSDLK